MGEEEREVRTPKQCLRGFFMVNDDRGEKQYMARAIELAAQGLGRTSPNPMVGAVVVRGGRIIGEGYHRRAGESHAEVAAIAAAGAGARGADLYVNLEPCSHQGRTPPCTDAVLEAGISRVFASMEDPNPLVSGRGGSLLREKGVVVAFGLLSTEASRLNECYIKYISRGLPFVILKSAMSLDGKTATMTGDSRWVSGPESRREVHRIRDAVDGVLVGIGTVLADDPMLTTRLPRGTGMHAARIVVDPFLKMPAAARMLEDKEGGPVFVAALEKAPVDRAAALRRRGAGILFCQEKEGRLDMVSLMKSLAGREMTSLLIEGGSAVAASALESGIVDKIVCFIAPKIVGGRDAPTPVGGKGVDLMRDALELRDVTYDRCGEDLMAQGYLSPGGN